MKTIFSKTFDSNKKVAEKRFGYRPVSVAQISSSQGADQAKEELNEVPVIEVALEEVEK